ncbi:MAG: hypothetical protein FWH14_02530 [Oscillospiraceae bacterium]|nr:hypothetical protein [Oscillospiraceae bacterium]
MLTVFVLSSCAEKDNSVSEDLEHTEKNNSVSENLDQQIEPQKIEDERYGSMSGDWAWYPSAKSLKDYSNLIVTGTVTDISFEILDSLTGLTPTEKSDPTRIQQYTFYHVDVIETYNGKKSKSIRVRIDGGISDFHVEEQVALLREYEQEHIFVWDDLPEIKIGETYLFVLYDFDNNFDPYPLNLNQTVYPVKEDPFRGTDNNPHFAQENPITAQDIITEFGTDKWDAFYTDWRRDNPDWETRLTGDSLERAKTAEREWTAAR